jgi:hypothetical protein
LLETGDLHLPNAWIITEAVRCVLEDNPQLEVPDAIVAVFTFGEPCFLEWIKDGDVWHPHLRGFVAL